MAPPTPPVGLVHGGAHPSPTSPLAATAHVPLPPPADLSATPAPPPSARGSALQRPPAPAVNFAPRNDPYPAGEPAGGLPLPGASAVPSAGVPCPLCGSTNQRGLRFCVSCGHLLAQPSGPQAALTVRPPDSPETRPTAPPPPAYATAAFTPSSSSEPIAPVRVVDLGSDPGIAAAARAQRLCPRCRGACEAAAQFCRFCGASLATAQVIHPSPSPIPAPPPAPEARAIASAPGAPAPAAPAYVPAGGAATATGTPTATHSPTTRIATAGRTRARLVLIARDGGEGPSYPVGETTDIGRLEGNVVIGDDRYISPRHARIALRSGSFFLRDLESVNGVFVRIPFERAASPGQGQPGPPGAPAGPSEAAVGRTAGATSGRAGAAANQPGQATEPNSGDSEQLLADQELFLVGQQVLRFDVVKHAEEGFGVASENGTLLFGTPAAPRYARLSQRTVEGVVRDVFHVRKGEMVIGRESGDVVFTDDPFLSRRHAVIRVYAGPNADSPRRFTIADLGSSNGTFLQVHDEVRLRHGDQFRIGQQLFRFDLDAVRAGA